MKISSLPFIASGKVLLTSVLLFLSMHLVICVSGQTTLETVFEIGPENTSDLIVDFEILEDGWLVTWNENTGGNPWTNYNRRVYVTKLDQSLQSQWTTELGGNQYDTGGNLIRLSDGNFCVATMSRSLADGFWSVSYVAKIAQDGSIIWDLTTGGQSFGDNYATGLFEDLNGNIVLYGQVQHHSGCTSYAHRITQISPTGNINWSNCSADLQWRVSSPILMNSGNYIYGSPINGLSEFRSVDQNGLETPINEYAPFGDNWSTFIDGRLEPSLNSNFLLVNWNVDNPILALFAENGDVIWDTFDWPAGFAPVRAEQLSDNQILVLARGVDGHFFRIYDLEGNMTGESDIITEAFLDNFTYVNDILYACGHMVINGDQQGVICSIDFPSLQLNDEELSEEECLPGSTPLNGLVAYYPFCGSSDDFSGNNLHSEISGPVFIEDRNGTSNAALHFDGVDDFLRIAHDPLLEFADENALSVSYWVKLNEYPPGSFLDIIFSKQSGSGNSQTGWNVAQNSTITQGLYVGNNGNIQGIGVGLLELNQWHHVTFTRSADISKAYLDGQLVIEQEVTTAIGANEFDLLIGKANWNNVNSQHFHGALDDIAIYNRALNAHEVNFLFWEDFCSPCQANYAMGDLDCNGHVGASDLLILLSTFGQSIE